MATYEVSRAFGELFRADMAAILGLEIYQPGTFLDDVRRGIDGMFQPLYLAERIRNITRYPSYKYQFTLRYRRDNGVKTEYAKLRDGSMHAEVYFYGWGDEHSRQIKAYILLDIPGLQTWIHAHGRQAGTIFDNEDGTYGIAFDLRHIPGQIIRAWKKLPDPRQLDLFTHHYTHAVIVK